jgi:anti-sigma regulatory factor (Ser/Thr protein kinase)
MPPDTAEATVQLYTAREAGEILGLNEEVVRRFARNRQFPHRKYGRIIRFTAEDIQDIIEHGYRPVVTP